MKKAWLFILFWLIALSLSAQSLGNDVVQAFKKGNYQRTSELLREAVETEKSERRKEVLEKALALSLQCDSLQKTADVYYMNKEVDRAIEAYMHVVHLNTEDVYSSRMLQICREYKKTLPDKTEVGQWFELLDKDSRIAYEVFIQTNPNSVFIKEANLILERKIWEEAVNEGTKFGYEDYLKKYPEGIYTKQMQAELDTVADMELWNIVCEVNTVEAFREYLVQSQLLAFEKEAHEMICYLIDTERWFEIQNSKDTLLYHAYINSLDTCKFFAVEAKKAIIAVRQEPFYKRAEIHYAQGDIKKTEATLDSMYAIGSSGLLNDELTVKMEEESEYQKINKSRNKQKLEAFLKKYPDSKYYKQIKQRSDAIKERPSLPSGKTEMALGVGVDVGYSAFMKIGMPKIEYRFGGPQSRMSMSFFAQHNIYYKSFYSEYGNKSDYELRYNEIAIGLGIQAFLAYYDQMSVFISFHAFVPFNFGGKFFGQSSDSWLNSSFFAASFGGGVAIGAHEISVFARIDTDSPIQKSSMMYEYEQLGEPYPTSRHRLEKLVDRFFTIGLGYTYYFKLGKDS